MKGGYTRIRRMTPELFLEAKKLITMNDTSDGGYTRKQLGEKVKPGISLSETTMSKVAVCDTYEDYLEKTANEKAKYAKKHVADQISVDDIAPDMRETPAGGLIIETEDERLIWEARHKLINCIDIINNQLTIIAKALELMFKDND